MIPQYSVTSGENRKWHCPAPSTGQAFADYVAPELAMETFDSQLSVSETLEAFNAVLIGMAGDGARGSVWFKESSARNLRSRDFLAPQAALTALLGDGKVRAGRQCAMASSRLWRRNVAWVKIHEKPAGPKCSRGPSCGGAQVEQTQRLPFSGRLTGCKKAALSLTNCFVIPIIVYYGSRAIKINNITPSIFILIILT